MRATSHNSGRKLLIAPYGLAHRIALANVGQPFIDALPERLSQRHSLGKRKLHCLGDELLFGHAGNLPIQAIFVNQAQIPSPLVGAGRSFSTNSCCGSTYFPVSFRITL